MNYRDYTRTRGVPEWPYPIEYGQETRDSADVLVIGGGLSGCFAAMHAARRGCSVILLEKGATVRSGSGGMGTDHWMFCATNPGCKVGVKPIFDTFAGGDPFCAGHLMWIIHNEAYPALLDLEKIGVKVRDQDGRFEGAPFRDPETKLLYAYDYDAKYCIRPFSWNQKIKLYEELQRLGVKIYDRVMGTSLLNADGKPGSPVTGCTALNVRTGRFYVFTAKATIMATAKPLRLWQWGSDTCGGASTHDDPNGAGDGDVMAYRAGAKLINMEAQGVAGGGQRMPPYSVGNSVSTWYPASMVDSQDKEIPWVDRDQRVLQTVDERNHSQPGQAAFIPMGRTAYETQGPYYAYDLRERVEANEFQQPFYADLSRMPAYERDVIFGMMISNEAKTYIPVFDKLSRSGFDPEKDMLQAMVLPPEAAGDIWDGFGSYYPGANGVNIRDVRGRNYGGILVDWTLKSSLDGLYAAGNNAFGIEGASSAAATGRYCGRSVARAVQGKPLPQADENQVTREKERLYANLNNATGYGWKEVQIGLCRIMQDYCGKYKNAPILQTGLWFLRTVRENEMRHLTVENPHELARTIETDFRLASGEIILNASLKRDSTCPVIEFFRTDCPEKDIADEHFTVLWNTGDGVCSEQLPLDFWLRGENAPTYEENYRRNACLEGEEEHEE